MALTMRGSRGEADFALIADLICSVPSTSRHLIDLPWRLSSPAFQSGDDSCLWEDGQGTLLGFAAWQVSWATLDFFIRPGSHQQMLETALFNWATQRFQELDRARGSALPYWVEFRDDDTERRTLIEAHGFLLNANYHYVQLSHSLALPLQEPILPEGFVLRPLAGEQEVAAYVDVHRAAFASTSMTNEWRSRTLRTPHYRPELDLVAVAPDGTLAGFCVGWLDQERQMGQVEPLGVHPRFRNIGLGRALLLEVLRRFKAFGAQSVLVETEGNQSSARHTYESVGFSLIHTIFRKGRIAQ
jgi:mycothiol synthase